MAKPDFFLVGGPKCGTSSLSDWLAQHPDIFISDPREPNFFASDLVMQRHFDSMEAYARHFDQKGERLGGEGTTWYLYSEQAPAEIHACNPNAKILMVLRDPTELACSLHNYRLYYGNETDTDLGRILDREASALQRWERSGEPRDVMRIYADVARYSAGVARYLEQFGAAQVRILWFEDLRSRPAELLREVYGFLGVDASFEPVLRTRNEGGTYRNRFLRDLVLRPGRIVRTAARLLPQSWRLHLGRAIRRANTEFGAKQAVDAAVMTRLQRELRPDVDRLQSLVERDLSAWCGGRS